MDSVTLITRPRRFGKTLTMNMVESFFSIDYKGHSLLFENIIYGSMKVIGNCREHIRL